jgi:type I restriction enzyme S subunit
VTDVPHGLPRGWLITPLRDIAEIVGGVTKDTKKSQGAGFREVPYLRVANVQRGRLDLTEMKLIAASEADIQKLSLQPGDILLNEGGDRDKLGRGWVWQGQLPVCIHQNHVFRARLLSSGIDPVYVAHFTNSMAQAYFAEHGSQTTNLASISLTKLGSLPVWLPPSNEQRRIVAKLDELFIELDAGVAELQAAQKKLAQYRQSLLKAAVEGALTADWRAAHPPQESGEALLARILQERRARWEARRLDKFKARGKTPPKGWQSKYPEPVAPDLNDLPGLPANWVWASLDQLAEIQGGIQKQPSRAPVLNKFPFLRVSNVARGALKLDDVHEIELFDGELDRLGLLANDLLIVEGNGSKSEIGRCTCWDGSIANAVHQNHLIRARPVLMSGPFLEAWINSHTGIQKLTDLAATTSGLYTLSVGKISKIPVPVAPIEEQVQVAQELLVRHGEIARMSDAVELSLKQAAAQRQNILRAAFTGQLVPQDPADEPASALLARIRAEQAALTTAPKKSRRIRVSA